jgi:hypothetical protein
MSQPRNTIRTFALVCVAATSAFTIGTCIWLINLLSTRDWCATAIGASKSVNASRPDFAVNGCFSLLNQQVEALAITLYIFAFVIALCLLVLMVIVVAGGKVSFKADKTGIAGDISEAGLPAPVAAQVVADAAQNKADQVKESQP